MGGDVMAGITNDMKRAAMAFESAAIEAGMDFAKCVYTSPAWRGDNGGLCVLGVDELNVKDEWKVGSDEDV